MNNQVSVKAPAKLNLFLRVLDKKANVVIDFSSPSAIKKNLNLAISNRTALVIGTTGISSREFSLIKNFSKKIPILMSSNMSLGVNLLFNIVQQASSILKDDDYDIEISETHHKHKKDAPSGTALSLGEYAAAGRRTKLNKVKVLDRTKKITLRKKGQIAIVSSPTGYRGLPTAAAYGMTKAGLTNLAESLFFDLKKMGIKVNIINPGFIESDSTKLNDFPMPFLKPADFAAKKIYNGLIKSNKFEITFPLFFILILKTLRILPYRLYFYLIRKMTNL